MGRFNPYLHRSPSYLIQSGSGIHFPENAVFIRRQTRHPPCDPKFPFECEAYSPDGDRVLIIGDDESFASCQTGIFDVATKHGFSPEWAQ